MPPPQLARDAPRLDIFQPVVIDFFTALGDDFGPALAHGLQRRTNDFCGLNKPLIGKHRLDHHARAVAKGLHDRFVFNIRHGFGDVFTGLFVGARNRGHHRQPLGGDIGDDLGAGLKPVKVAIGLGHHVDGIDLGLGERRPLRITLGFGNLISIGRAIPTQHPTGIHQAVHRDAATLGHLIVVEVMRAGDFHRTRAEIGVGIVIGDDRDQAAVFFWANRNLAQFANNWRIAQIIGVHRNRAIPQHGFGARGGDRDVITGLFERDISVGIFFDIGIALPPREGVFEMPHMAVNFGILDLKI